MPEESFSLPEPMNLLFAEVLLADVRVQQRVQGYIDAKELTGRWVIRVNAVLVPEKEGDPR